jgi:hypothetical protein
LSQSRTLLRSLAVTLASTLLHRACNALGCACRAQGVSTYQDAVRVNNGATPWEEARIKDGVVVRGDDSFITTVVPALISPSHSAHVAGSYAFAALRGASNAGGTLVHSQQCHCESDGHPLLQTHSQFTACLRRLSQLVTKTVLAF